MSYQVFTWQYEKWFTGEESALRGIICRRWRWYVNVPINGFTVAESKQRRTQTSRFYHNDAIPLEIRRARWCYCNVKRGNVNTMSGCADAQVGGKGGSAAALHYADYSTVSLSSPRLIRASRPLTHISMFFLQSVWAIFTSVLTIIPKLYLKWSSGFKSMIRIWKRF